MPPKMGTQDWFQAKLTGRGYGKTPHVMLHQSKTCTSTTWPRKEHSPFSTCGETSGTPSGQPSWEPSKTPARKSSGVPYWESYINISQGNCHISALNCISTRGPLAKPLLHSSRNKIVTCVCVRISIRQSSKSPIKPKKP